MLVCLPSALPVRGAGPKPEYPIIPSDTNASLGATVSFRVYASTTNPPMTYPMAARRDQPARGHQLPPGLTNVTVADAGGYMAWITNASGASTNTRTAIAHGGPTFTKITTGRVVTDVRAGARQPGGITTMMASSTCTWRTPADRCALSQPARRHIHPGDHQLHRQCDHPSRGAVGDYNNDGNEDLLPSATGVRMTSTETMAGESSPE